MFDVRHVLPVVLVLVATSCKPVSGEFSDLGQQPDVGDAAVDIPEFPDLGTVDAVVELPDADSALMDVQPVDAFCTIEDTSVGYGECPQPPPFFVGVDAGAFLLFPDKIDSAQLTPGTPVTYWEERFCYRYTEPDCRVVRSFGNKCAEATDKAKCEQEFDALETDPGHFGDGGCDPESCFTYWVVNRGDENFIVGDGDVGLRDFLYPVDTIHEVKYILGDLQYATYSSEPSNGGYREVSDGWEIIATRWSEPCFPVTYDRYLLHFDREGHIKVLCRQLCLVQCDACV